MKLGEIRNLVSQVTIKHSKEERGKKKDSLEKDISQMIKYIKKELGDFAVVADNKVLLERSELIVLYEKLKKYLQE